MERQALCRARNGQDCKLRNSFTQYEDSQNHYIVSIYCWIHIAFSKMQNLLCKVTMYCLPKRGGDCSQTITDIDRIYITTFSHWKREVRAQRSDHKVKVLLLLFFYRILLPKAARSTWLISCRCYGNEFTRKIRLQDSSLSPG